MSIKIIKLTVLLVCICFLLRFKVYSYNWPFKEGGVQTVEQKIRQTVCAYRSPPPYVHFHEGIDIVPNDTINNKTAVCVNEAEGDTIAYHYGSDAIRVGDLYYFHLDDRIPDSSVVHKGDSLGTIIKVGSAPLHLHFQHYQEAPNVLNPLDSLTPFTDDYSPKIDSDSIEFFQQGGGPQIHKDSLHDKVDIDVMVYDTLNHSVTEHKGRVYPYKIGFKVKDTLGNVLKDTVKIWFDKVPPHVNVDWILRSTNNTYPTFRITNVALNGDTVEDHYWNTMQKVDTLGNPYPDSVDADSIEDALFKDGFFWVKVLAYDSEENADSDSVYVHIDNFDPKVKEKHPENWKWIVANTDTIIWCRFSEVMDTLTLTASNIKVFSFNTQRNIDIFQQMDILGTLRGNKWVV